ncbi:branched-chain amino acid ABC transporter permease [Nakamurella antarctica]|uniref:Branched-chain amino acid ABC transporter permease n=2 Tax=Nakamurella antarctica TaxID=1902245 RepID=A0A3G8ZQE5_9ACTN|nr:branched-chain amino acid ABC transporter permease [Nakamurella antarctica]
MYLFSSLAGSLGISASGTWQNLGSGGWMTAAAFFLFAGTGFVVATVKFTKSKTIIAAGLKLAAPKSSDAGGLFGSPATAKTLLLLVFAAALFYPPTATSFWQSVLVTQIGIYVLLAIGLNVVVGWAGLLDLGFIAFYAIGSYVTAYLVGSLPPKPPWGTMSPLFAIPFAIAVCLVAGVILGGPTLRLRGDYLAIVTLGFGEIVRIVAINADDVTNSTRGPSPQVPHPVINLGFTRFEFGLDQLQYWYLLLIIIVIVVVLFRALEHSRTGRAWAAIREDEVAAQASGVNTFRFKLLAFAIGASTSGIAGVFFASDVGFFTPDNFILNNSILVVAYVVFGGMGSLPGAMAGAAVLTWLPEFLKDQVPAEDRQMWIGAVVLLMMIFRPGGLIPAKRRSAELHDYDHHESLEVSAVPAGEGMGAKA